MSALDGRTVLVTGAGAGIGRGIALACGAAGAHVIVTGRRSNADDVADEIRSRGDAATAVRCDVSDLDSVRGAIATALDATGALHGVVHNATSGRSSQPHALAAVTRDEWDDHTSVSLRGAFNCATAAFPALSATGGTLLVMTSPAGVEGSATLPLYAAMKGGLRGFAKSLAREWGLAGVTVNVVSPLGLSPAMEAAIEADPPMAERLASRVPIGRVGDAETDVGAGVVLLLGPEAGYITGQTLGIDGGHFLNI